MCSFGFGGFYFSTYPPAGNADGFCEGLREALAVFHGLSDAVQSHRAQPLHPSIRFSRREICAEVFEGAARVDSHSRLSNRIVGIGVETEQVIR